MYEQHFHLDQTPFSIAPDPAFLYLSEGHTEALAHLTYGLSHGGFVLITGEVGTGKTTLLRNLLKQTPDDLDVAFVLNPRLTARELLETLCDELGVAYPAGTSLSVKQYIDALNRHLLDTHQQGRGTVVIIDEAQNLSPAVLEQIRLLTNLETDKRKLLRIILIGQPELADLLARNELRQLAQRITARYHLGGLSREDTYAYVVHRLARAGGNPNLFTRAALRRLYRISRGIPRIINLVADRALLGAYAEGRHRVGAGLVRRAAGEVLGPTRQTGRWIAVGAATALAAGAASAYLLLPASDPTGPAATAPTLAGAADPARTGPDAPVAPIPRNDNDRTPSDGTDDPDDWGVPDASNHSNASDDAMGAPASTTVAGASADAAPAPDPGTGPASAEAPPPAAPRKPVHLSRPDMPAFQTQRYAYEHVFERWNVDLDAWNRSTIPCNFAPSVGLQCLTQTGSWSDIRHLDLPVVLELWGQESTPFYAAVTGVEGETYELFLGRERFLVEPRDLQDAWFGSFVVLWRMPPDYAGTLKRGDRHPSVRWLRQQLTDLGVDTPDSDLPALFDARLEDAVLDFQREEDLLADGIVGPATWIRIGQRMAQPAPRLDG